MTYIINVLKKVNFKIWTNKLKINCEDKILIFTLSFCLLIFLFDFLFIKKLTDMVLAL